VTNAQREAIPAALHADDPVTKLLALLTPAERARLKATL
jgi:hypothetical protein